MTTTNTNNVLEITGNTTEQQKAINEQEYKLELWAVYNDLQNNKIRGREISEDNNRILVCNDGEIVFDTENKTATIMQYFDGEYRPVSRLVIRDYETVWDFMKRAELKNEQLRDVILFEDR